MHQCRKREWASLTAVSVSYFFAPATAARDKEDKDKEDAQLDHVGSERHKLEIIWTEKNEKTLPSPDIFS